MIRARSIKRKMLHFTLSRDPGQVILQHLLFVYEIFVFHRNFYRNLCEMDESKLFYLEFFSSSEENSVVTSSS